MATRPAPLARKSQIHPLPGACEQSTPLCEEEQDRDADAHGSIAVGSGSELSRIPCFSKLSLSLRPCLAEALGRALRHRCFNTST